MNEARPYPYERWPRLSRSEARSASRYRSLAVGFDAFVDEWIRCTFGATTDHRCRRSATARVVGPFTPDTILVNADEMGGYVATLAHPEGSHSLLRMGASLTALRLAQVFDFPIEQFSRRPLLETEQALLDNMMLSVLGALRSSSLPYLARSGCVLHPALRIFRAHASLLHLSVRVECEGRWGRVAGLIEAILPTRLSATAPYLQSQTTRGAVALEWMELVVDLGVLRLSRTQLQSLCSGDLLFPEVGVTLKEADALEPVWLRSRGGAQARCRLTVGGSRWSLRLAPGRSPEERQTMTVDKTTSADTTLDEVLATAPIELAVELGRLQLSASSLTQLRAGDCVELAQEVGAPVSLVVAGREIGEGELVDIEGQVGVRILWLRGEGEKDPGNLQNGDPPG